MEMELKFQEWGWSNVEKGFLYGLLQSMMFYSHIRVGLAVLLDFGVVIGFYRFPIYKLK